MKAIRRGGIVVGLVALAACILYLANRESHVQTSSLVATSPATSRTAASAQDELAELQKISPRTPEIQDKIYLLQGQLLTQASEGMLNSGAIDLKGEVVDEDGKPLEQVRLAIIKIKAANLGWKNKSEGEEVTVSKTFHVRAKGLNGVNLIFSKEGYYSIERFLPLDSKRDYARELGKWEQTKLADGNVGVKVVLEKKGTRTWLVERSFNLTYVTDGSGSIIDLSVENGKTVEVKSIDASSRTFQHAVAVNSVGEDGHLLHITRDPNTSIVYPKSVRLVMTGKDDGFTKMVTQRPNKFQHAMRRAPADGYQSEISFDGEQFQAQTRYGSLQCSFFVKANGLYGRGWVSAHVDEEVDSTLHVYVLLQFQPDGSTNLETGE